MATTVTPSTLKARATAFASFGDSVVQAAIDEATRWTSETEWGSSHYDDGIFYLACHILDEDAALNAAGSGGGGSATPAGPMTSEKLLTWSASWATPDEFNDALATTGWGRRYISARQRVFSSRCI